MVTTNMKKDFKIFNFFCWGDSKLNRWDFAKKHSYSLNTEQIFCRKISKAKKKFHQIKQIRNFFDERNGIVRRTWWRVQSVKGNPLPPIWGFKLIWIFRPLSKLFLEILWNKFCIKKIQTLKNKSSKLETVLVLSLIFFPYSLLDAKK